MKANDINKIEDFGQKIGGARKDYYAEAREAASRHVLRCTMERGKASLCPGDQTAQQGGRQIFNTFP